MKRDNVALFETQLIFVWKAYLIQSVYWSVFLATCTNYCV